MKERVNKMKQKLTIGQKILANKAAYRSYISEEFLRFAKQKAEESHRAAVLAQEAYNKEHGTHHRIPRGRQHD